MIKCAASRPFDLVVFRDRFVALIEVKPKGRLWDQEQLEKQRELVERAGVEYIFLRQLPKKGYIEARGFDGIIKQSTAQILREVFGRYIT